MWIDLLRDTGWLGLEFMSSFPKQMTDANILCKMSQESSLPVTSGMPMG